MNYKSFSVFILFLAGCELAQSGYSFSSENNLRTLLWTTNSYQRLSRPNGTVTVYLSYSPITLNELDIVDQSMAMAGFFSFKWNDSRLAWQNNPTYSSDIPTIFSTQSYTWFPTLIIENSVSSISILMDSNSLNPIRILSDGLCVYNPIDVYSTHCESDSTYYPFDTQECDVQIAAWAYTVDEISLQWTDGGLDMAFFNENGGWSYKKYEISTEVSYRGSTSFPVAILKMYFKRRPLFQVINTVAPCTMLAFLIIMTFKLPPDSGERMGFSLTVLLAYAVYLTIVSANLPTTSLTTSVLSIYLLLTLTAGALCVGASIIVLRCHCKKEDEPVPSWIQKKYNGLPGKFAGVAKSTSNTKIHNIARVEVAEVEKKPNAENKTVSNNPNVVNTEESIVDWPKVTVFLDEFLFRAFFLFTVAEQIIFLIVFVYGYASH